MTQFYINSIGVVAPGFNGFIEFCDVLSYKKDYLCEPVNLIAPNMLPANERRRSSDSVRLALSVAEQVMSDFLINDSVSAVFSSSFGDSLITHKLCEQLSLSPPMASPILFHNSVHNAPAGYWSIATKNMCPTNSIACGNSSFSAGLIAAVSDLMSQSNQVLFVCYDIPYPFPLSEECTTENAFACAILLSSVPGQQDLATITLETTNDEITVMNFSEIELLRKDNPAARCLPLLELISYKKGECVLEYLDGINLKVKICA